MILAIVDISIRLQDLRTFLDAVFQVNPGMVTDAMTNLAITTFNAYRNGVPPKPKGNGSERRSPGSATRHAVDHLMQQSLWRRDASHRCGSRAGQQTPPPLLLLDCAVPASAQVLAP